MRELLTQEQTLGALRALMTEARGRVGWGILRRLDPLLLRVTELQFGTVDAAVEAVGIPPEQKAVWSAYWEGQKKRGAPIQKSRNQLWEKLLARPQTREVSLSEALSTVENNENFQSCNTPEELEILSRCVLHDVQVIDPVIDLKIGFGDRARWLAPLARRYAARTGRTLLEDDWKHDDRGLQALRNLTTDFQELGTECGIHVPKGPHEKMAVRLLDEARRNRLVPRLVERLAAKLSGEFAERLKRCEQRREDFTPFEEAIARIRRYKEG